MRYIEIKPSYILVDAFQLYRRMNLTRSQEAFSRHILGMKPSYYSCMVSRGRQPSVRVLETLISVTTTIMGTFLGNPHFRQPYAENLNTAYDQLDGLIAKVRMEINFIQAQTRKWVKDRSEVAAPLEGSPEPQH